MNQRFTNSPNRVKAPQQSRSADTLERILAATAQLLEHQRFEEITVAAIVKAARSSVGAFYARFADKEALLDALDERYMRQALAALDSGLPSDASGSLAPEFAVRAVVEGTLAFHRRTPGLIRALVMRARTAPDRHYQRRGDTITVSLFARVLSLLGPHARSERSVALGLFAVLSAIREVVLFPEGPAKGVAIDDDTLVDELTGLFLRYIDPKETPQ